MKRIIAAILFLLMIISVTACGQASPAETLAADRAKAWMVKNLKANSLLSFTYDGVEYAEHIDEWKKSYSETEDGWKLTYSRDGLELVVDITYNAEHASLEWVGQWTNHGSSNTKVISDIKILDAEFAIEDAVMTTANCGGQNSLTDYQPYSVDLVEVGYTSKSNIGGRSTQNAWPYFDLMSGDDSYGVLFAIGWTGNWACAFDYQDGDVRVNAGMQTTRYYMEPQETLRTPSIVLQFFNGDQDVGHNAWRKLILDCYTPTDVHTGEAMRYAPITINTWGGAGSETLLTTMNDVKQSGQYFEYQWIDAGWYGDYVSMDTYTTQWKTELGNWYYNPGYPNGFKEIAEWHKENGTGFLVWFEPARAFAVNDLPQEHPEWFLPPELGNEHWYYDYGIEEACDYMIDLIIGFLDDMGCDFYRQDYNFNPDKGWGLKDEKLDPNGNRKGVAEIQYVTGHYRFLDAVIASGRMFDNCASGGRLLDIEMTKRGIPLWRTDYTVSGQDVKTVASGVRSQGASLSWWLPLHGGMGTKEGTSSEYTFRSIMATGATLGKFSDSEFAKKMLDEMVYNRELMLGDYYILQQGIGDDTEVVNAGYEFYREDMGEGFVVCFRPNESTEEYTTYVLKGLDAQATYEVRNVDNDQRLTMTGEELMSDGIKAYFPRTQVSHMIYITKQ